jgi:hypothetical protein
LDGTEDAEDYKFALDHEPAFPENDLERSGGDDETTSATSIHAADDDLRVWGPSHDALSTQGQRRLAWQTGNGFSFDSFNQ